MPVIEHPLNFRTGFDEVAAEYDAIRPGYPAALIEDIISITHLPANGHILEIGCGTGQATIPFAQRGYRMTCLDIGAALAALAAQNCQAYPSVQIQVASFETWEAEPRSFDLIISATAFHWIPPEIGYPKAASLLKDIGSLAIFSNEHPPVATGFFAEVQQVHQRVVPEMQSDPQDVPSLQVNIDRTAAMINATGLFEPVLVKTYPWTATYTTAEYLRLLNTYSPNRQMSEEKRTQLFQGIADLMEGSYGGVVTKPYLAVLYLAKKRSSKDQN
jgi:SAM-dependent methyltransferase